MYGFFAGCPVAARQLLYTRSTACRYLICTCNAVQSRSNYTRLYVYDVPCVHQAVVGRVVTRVTINRRALVN